MKRILLALVALVLMCGTSHALTVGGDSDTWQTLNIENTAGSAVTTYIPVSGVVGSNTYINPKMHKILGFEVLPTDGSSENWVSVFDCGNLDKLSNENFFGEVECYPQSWDGMWFPRPKYLSVGLAVKQGAHTRAVIYFTMR